MVAILLLNVKDVFSVGGGVLLDKSCVVFQRMCVLCLCSQCAYKCSFHRICLCLCMSEFIYSFKSLIAGPQVLALLMLFICVILCTMWSGNSLELLYILPFGILCLSAISLMFVKKYVDCVCPSLSLCLPCSLFSLSLHHQYYVKLDMERQGTEPYTRGFKPGYHIQNSVYIKRISRVEYISWIVPALQYLFLMLRSRECGVW